MGFDSNSRGEDFISVMRHRPKSAEKQPRYTISRFLVGVKTTKYNCTAITNIPRIMHNRDMNT